MTSLWTTYFPGSPPTGDVKHSEYSEPDTSHPANSTAVTSPVRNSNATYPDPADHGRDFPTASLEPVEPDAKLVCMETPSVHGRIGPNSFTSSVTSANGIPMETTDKTAPIVVSATSLSVKFRPAMSSSSPYGANLSTQRTSMSERLDNAVARVIGPSGSLPTHNRVNGPQRSPLPGMGDTIAQTAHFRERVATSPEPGSTLERHLFASAPITNSSAAAPIPTATDRPPSPLSISTNPILTTDVNATSSPSNGASRPTPPNVTLSPNLNRERNYQERRVPKRSVTDGTSVSGGSIVKSQYTDMVFEEVPRVYSILSFLFTWILLAGFIVLPGTFNTLEGLANGSTQVKKALHTIQHLPLLAIGYACCGIGGIGMCLLWWRWSHNYVWLINSIFVPGLLNGLSGLLSTFAGIYGSQNGAYGTSSIITLAVTGGCTIVCGMLTAIYSWWKLGAVKRRHSNEMEQTEYGGTIMGERQYFA